MVRFYDLTGGGGGAIDGADAATVVPLFPHCTHAVVGELTFLLDRLRAAALACRGYMSVQEWMALDEDISDAESHGVSHAQRMATLRRMVCTQPLFHGAAGGSSWTGFAML